MAAVSHRRGQPRAGLPRGPGSAPAKNARRPLGRRARDHTATGTLAGGGCGVSVARARALRPARCPGSGSRQRIAPPRPAPTRTKARTVRRRPPTRPKRAGDRGRKQADARGTGHAAGGERAKERRAHNEAAGVEARPPASGGPAREERRPGPAPGGREEAGPGQTFAPAATPTRRPRGCPAPSAPASGSPAAPVAGTADRRGQRREARGASPGRADAPAGTGEQVGLDRWTVTEQRCLSGRASADRAQDRREPGTVRGSAGHRGRDPGGGRSLGSPRLRGGD